MDGIWDGKILTAIPFLIGGSLRHLAKVCRMNKVTTHSHRKVALCQTYLSFKHSIYDFFHLKLQKEKKKWEAPILGACSLGKPLRSKMLRQDGSGAWQKASIDIGSVFCATRLPPQTTIISCATAQPSLQLSPEAMAFSLWRTCHGGDFVTEQ